LIQLQQNILKVLSYFDIFNYPLLAAEITCYLEVPSSIHHVNKELETLQQKNLVFKLDEFYSLKDDIFMAIRRRDGNRLAVPEMEKAKKAAALLYQFPFVKGLAISGSLSKNFADENSDIDFFIITKANRLWIARTLMHIFYKWAAFRKQQRLFCMNYYVDETALEIPEKNIFTAMEIVTLIPLKGSDCISRFMDANKWTKSYFPETAIKEQTGMPDKKGLLGRIAEKLLSGNWGNALDNWLLALTGKHWQQKKQQLKVNNKGIFTSMLADKHYAKPDPKNFQHKILLQYETRVKNISTNTSAGIMELSSATK
jgi:Nucleotidyltransferase domain